MDHELPDDMAEGASFRGNEYGWSISSFPNVLAKAEKKGYACLGGQFQFHLGDESICEMYWLSADSAARGDGESWNNYVHRSCGEVLAKFRKVLSQTDFAKEAQSWTLRIDPVKHLVFVGYFVNEADLMKLAALRTSSP